MARKRIALSQFTVSSPVDDYGVELTHSYRQCDWRTWVEGNTPVDILRAARAHARVCDGKPQPRPVRVPASSGGFVPAVWAQAIQVALATRMMTPSPSGAADDKQPFVTGLPAL